MLGIATLFWNLQVPGKGSNIKGPDGKPYDGATPSAFKLQYRKDGSVGIRVSRTEIYSDPSAAMVGMLKTGMLKAEDLMK